MHNTNEKRAPKHVTIMKHTPKHVTKIKHASKRNRLKVIAIHQHHQIAKQLLINITLETRFKHITRSKYAIAKHITSIKHTLKHITKIKHASKHATLKVIAIH
jgi:hypothetical protein